MKAMMPYILEQPALFRQMLQDRAAIAAPFVEAVKKADPDRLIIVASGTSRNASAAAVPFIEWVFGLPVEVVAPSELDLIAGKKPFLIFVSQGGNSTNTIAAIERVSMYPSLALTGDPNGHINALCPHAVLIPCGEEKAGPKTKGYICTILTLYLMALEASHAKGNLTVETYNECLAHLATAAEQLQPNIDRTIAWVQGNADNLKKLKVVYLTGKLQSSFVAAEGALKLMETLLIPAVSFDFEEYLHGPSCSINPDVAGMYLLPPTGDPDRARMHGLLEYHRSLCSEVYAFGPEAGEDPRDLSLLQSGAWYTQPFEQILPMQVISCELPDMLGLDGVGSKRFQALDKKLKIKFKSEG